LGDNTNVLKGGVRSIAYCCERCCDRSKESVWREGVGVMQTRFHRVSFHLMPCIRIVERPSVVLRSGYDSKRGWHGVRDLHSRNIRRCRNLCKVRHSACLWCC